MITTLPRGDETEKNEKRNKRIFLEDICDPPRRSGKTKHWIIKNPQKSIGTELPLPPEIHVIVEPHGKHLALHPMLAGTGARHYNMKLTRNLVSASTDFLLPHLRDRIVTFKIPNGGNGMSLTDHIGAFAFGHGITKIPVPPEVTMKIKRTFDDEIDDYRTEILGFSDDGTRNIFGDIYVLADYAMASGSSIELAAKVACEGHDGLFRIKGSIPKLKKIIAYFGVGSIEGLSRLYKYCQKFNIELIPVFSCVLYQVTDGKNILPYLKGKTDLPFANIGTITTRDLFRDSQDVYGNVPVCVAGDTGRRFYDIYVYWIERLWETLIIQEKYDKFPIDHTAWKLARRMTDNPDVMHFLSFFQKATRTKKELLSSDMKNLKKAIDKLLW
ncbi:MAG: hypothetical protein ACTSRA_20335 [Promethearchaeota archaeon]